ncbi:MAG: hypothetical protein NC834_03385 [Candidatus Omnitrophica bacterium]|nr:hypothetical protein [Candidatus Omnitrophota bacterium]
MKRELSVFKELNSSFGGMDRKYLYSLQTWRELVAQREKERFLQELFSLWYRLKLAQKKYYIEKERETLLHSLSELTPQFPKPPLEKILKEIEAFQQRLSLLEKEKEIASLGLELRKKMALPLNFKMPLSSPEDKEEDLEVLYEKHFPESSIRKKEKEAYQKLKKNEIPLFLRKEGKLIYFPKEKILLGDLNPDFMLEITSQPPSHHFGEPNFNPEEYFQLKEQLEKEREEKERNCDQELLKITRERIQSLKRRLSEEEELLKDLEKKSSLDIGERIIYQKMRILQLKKQILEKEEDYLIDFLSSKNHPPPILLPFQEKILWEKLSPIIKKERLPSLNKLKEKENLYQAMLASSTRKNLDEEKNKFQQAHTLLQEIFLIFSLKEKMGLILPEELSELKLLKDNLEEEIYQNQRKMLNIKKREPLLTELKPISVTTLSKKVNSFSLPEEIIQEDPYLKLISLERQFSLPSEFDFLNYLYRERETKIKKDGKLLPEVITFQNFLLNSLKETENLLEEQFKNALRNLNTEAIGLYGAYGMSSILSKYLQGIKKLSQTKESLAEAKIKLWNIIENKKPSNLLSIIPPQFSLFWKKVIPSLRKEPFLIRERKKRRKEFIFKNYAQKTHAFNFLKKEKEKENLLQPIKELFKTAWEKELKTTEYLDKLWEKEKAFRERIGKNLVRTNIDIEKEISPLAELLSLKEDQKEILKLILINYAQRLKKEKFLKSYIEDLGKLLTFFPLDTEKIDLLANWWTKYISPLLPYPEKTHLEDIIDPRVLGLYLYYIEMKNSLGLENIPSLTLQIEKDKEFLFLDPYHIPQEKLQDYLSWEAEKKREMEKLFFSQWPFESWENKRKKFLRLAKGIFGYTYGSLKDKTLQREIINWLIVSGVNEEEFPEFIELIETTLREIKKFFPNIPREEKLKIKEAVRLRWLLTQKESSLFSDEEKRLDEAILMGELLSWTEFFWENKITKEEIPRFFSFMENLKRNLIFTSIYGEYENLGIEHRDFYISSLSYWAENWLKFYREDPAEAEEKIKNFLSRFQLIYSLPPFQKLYGPVDLKKINPQKWREKKLLREFLGKSGFFLNWTLDFSLTDIETENFFSDLYTLFIHKEILENFYRKQGIELKFSWENYEEREEFMGILINWIQFFHYRGVKGEKGILSALREIEFIQEKSQEYNLSLNTDEIRYWWEKTKLKGYELSFLEKIFSHAHYVENLLPQVCAELLAEISRSPSLIGENLEIRKKFIKAIKDYKKKFSRAEIYNLAERIIPVYNLDLEELKEYYKEKIYLEIAYQIFNQEKALPRKISLFYFLMKEWGYSLKEMGDFIYLYSRLRKNNILTQTFPSDLEIYGLLNHLFEEIPPYEKRLSVWLEKASFLNQCFYHAHKRYLDFSLLKNLLNYSLLRLRPWQVKLLVEKGALSRNSPDIEIREISHQKDFERYILRLYWENLKEILPREERGKLYKIYETLSEEKAKITFKEAIERYALFQEEFIELILQNFLKKNIPFEEFFSYGEERLSLLRKTILPSLLLYLSSEKEEEIRIRQKKFLYLKEFPSKGRIYQPQSFDKRKVFQKEIREKAKNLFSLDLPPHRSSALTWKALEGLSIEEVLKVYIEDYQKLETMYKRIFSKDKLNFEDIQIINYFSEEINFGDLDREVFIELMNIAKEIKEGLEKNSERTLSLQEALDYSWSVLYSGGDKIITQAIFLQVENIKKIFPEVINDASSLKDILFITGNLYNIEIGEKSLYVYPQENYLQLIKYSLGLLSLKGREINYNQLEEIAKTAQSLFLPPTKFLSSVWKTNYLWKFLNRYASGVSKKEILIYLDLIKKDTLNFLNLSKAFYEIPASIIIIQKIETNLSLAFKNFLKEIL